MYGQMHMCVVEGGAEVGRWGTKCDQCMYA